MIAAGRWSTLANWMTGSRLALAPVLVVAIVAGSPWVAALVFAGTLGNGLVYDDPMALARAAESPAALAVRRFGLTYLTIHAERLVWGDWVPGFHLGNVVLHAVASGLAAVLARRLGARPWAACAAGLLFAVHPVHAEAVASIENRKEMLAMIFAATSVLLWLRPQAWATAAALVAWGLAMHAKEVAAVGLAIVLPLADVLIHRLPVRRALVRTVPVVALGVLATALYGGNVLAHFTPAAVEKATSGAATSSGDALLVSAAAVPSLVRLLVFPLTLSADYPTPSPAGLLDGTVLAGVVVVALALVAFALATRRAPLVAFAIAWTVAMYLPLANVVPLGPHFVAERYLYVPSFGVCLLAALGLDAVRRRAPPAAVAALALLVAAGAVRSMARVPDWRDALSLWESAAGAIPGGSGRIHAELGLAYSRAERSQEAIDHFRRSIALGPEKADTQSNLGLELLKVGQVEASIPHFARAVEIWPENPIFHYNLGTALLRSGRYAAALDELRIASSDEAWRRADPSVGAALAARGLTERDFRASIAQWIAENATKIQPRGR